ncbi:MAG: ATP-dependent DNA helicase RecG [Tannerellaceae bacterium]|jgi:ATP-dependent DNA helicase RecG|nr:ATP-dependent DNA helicase RecG [Tannerellaceae bacterium]
MIDLGKRSIMYLPGIGPRKGEILRKEAEIVSFEDLLYYFPYKYADRSRIYPIRSISGNMPYIQLKGRILSLSTLGEGSSRRLIARFTDGTGTIDLVWFKGIAYVREKLKPDKEYLVFGKPVEFGNALSMPHPEIDPAEQATQLTGGLTPFYHTTDRMKKAFLNSRAVQNLQYTLLSLIRWQLPETLSEDVLERTRMLSLSEAMRNIHFPESDDKLRAARLRLKFDELFFIQLNILCTAAHRKRAFEGLPCPVVGTHFHRFYHDYLPFPLTEAQKRVVREIRADMGSGRQMNRLLQGDVGSGKTLVALLAILLAVDNGYQACLMAPSEILAAQHYATLRNFLGDMPLELALLTGSTRRKERQRILSGIASGAVSIVIGTHALVEESVRFASLGLAVIDEQHRFGVEQRARLRQKSPGVPHVLVMTATPIPRTLAMTLYGDLDVSVIDELPPGRKPVRTLHRYDSRKAELYDFLRKEIERGRQVYVVYPLIEESEKSDYKNLEEGFRVFCEVLAPHRVCMVHGRMKASDKESEMRKFVSGEAQILLATTVIEVGVDVPNASVMVIESAERFGLSQLHQLRGRVGRGSEQSYCVLVSSSQLSRETRRRLEIMVQTNNGFEIAEEDLRLRGGGDLEGTRQSGLGVNLKIANLSADGPILHYAREIAGELLAADPLLEQPAHQRLSRQLKTRFGNKPNWGDIS